MKLKSLLLSVYNSNLAETAVAAIKASAICIGCIKEYFLCREKASLDIVSVTCSIV